MAELFHSLFGRHGHVYQHPRYKKDTDTYEWNLAVIVDDSFEFLLSTASDSADWILSKPAVTWAYLAGFFDAEGSVGIYPMRLSTSLNVIYYNTDLDLLWFVHRAIKGLGFSPLDPYLDKKKGFRSPGYHIEMKKDYWRVLMARFEEVQKFLDGLPLRHAETMRKKTLAVSLVCNQSWKETGPLIQGIRSEIKSARDAFVAEARRAYLTNPRHKLGPQRKVTQGKSRQSMAA